MIYAGVHFGQHSSNLLSSGSCLFFFYSQSSENVIVFAWSQLDLLKLAVFVLIEIAPEGVSL